MALDAIDRLLHFFLAVFGFVAVAIDEIRREHHERQQLQELRLPVLERRLEERPNVPGGAPDRGGLTMLDCFRLEFLPACYCLQEPTKQKEQPEDDSQAVVLPQAPHNPATTFLRVTA